ncbi:hypothetical protein QC763_609210 [Podospora pseudopauciseta]|uniref:Uncharacterized protein n=1 Tax=Podospora pseudopauciseta TaxID=2093780 RepID=A0ABR0H6L7_9PEZI|nr:hypothetical protein QC763_609210 [Podospora pseudopauciseta]
MFQVFHVARLFAKHGLIVHANEMPAPKEKKAPRLLAAHYGGQDVTFLGRLIFPHVENLVVDARTFPIRDPWPVNPKSLSLVYTFGDSPTDEKWVFVSKAGEDTVWTLTSDDIKTQPPGVTLASAWPPEVPGRIKIYAVIYGLEQITHPTVYRRLYEAASRNERIYISNKFFSNSPLINEDPWRGTIKSAAIVYTIRGKWKSISGREREYMSWEL